MSGVVRALKVLHTADVHVVSVDAVIEEVVAEQSTDPAEICVTGAVSHRCTEVVRADRQAGLFVQLTRRSMR
jgi:hypothetical protein